MRLLKGLLQLPNGFFTTTEFLLSVKKTNYKLIKNFYNALLKNIL